MKFGHILAPDVSPPELLKDAVGGMPRVGVCATVKSIEQGEGGTLKVYYQGQRRFKLLMVDDVDDKPYKVRCVQFHLAVDNT